MEAGDAGEDALPALAPLPNELSEEEKRARQRLHVKRTYYRKLNVLQDLRDRVARMETEYAHLMSRQMRAQTAQDTISTASSESAHSSELLTLYTQVSAKKEDLRQQNQALRAAIHEYEQFRTKLESLATQERRVVTSSEAEDLRLPTLQAPVGLAVCQEIARATYAQVLQFRASDSYLTTGMSVFGWRDKRMVNGNLVRFSLRKVYPKVTPLSLSLRAWAIESSCEDLRKLYSASLDLKLYALQHVDEDNVIMCRIIKSPDKKTVIRSIFLVARFETPEGLAIVFRSLDPSYVNPQGPPPLGVTEYWRDYCAWTIFDAGTDKHGEPVCDYEFGGEVMSTPVMDTNMWMLEVLLMTLRWESLIFGSMFSLSV